MSQELDPLYINLLLRSLSIDLETKYCNFLSQYNLSPGRFKVLVILRALPDSEGMMPSHLATKVGVKLPTISLLIRDMEDSGLLRRTYNRTKDRRARHIHLTHRGHELISKISPEWQLRVHVFLSCLNREEHKQLDEILKKMQNNVCALDSRCQ